MRVRLSLGCPPSCLHRDGAEQRAHSFPQTFQGNTAHITADAGSLCSSPPCSWSCLPSFRSFRKRQKFILPANFNRSQPVICLVVVDIEASADHVATESVQWVQSLPDTVTIGLLDKTRVDSALNHIFLRWKNRGLGYSKWRPVHPC
jgi:hypothetical protein